MKISCIARIGINAVSAIVIATLGVSSSWAQNAAPNYEADVTFPKPFPNRWVSGGFGGHCIDDQGHVLLLNRQDVLDGELNAGRLAPLMIELDPSGKVVHSWGDPGLIEGTVPGLRNGPTAFRLHTCHFDKDNNVWIASSPGGMIQKYTHDGSRLLQQIGVKGVFDTSNGTIKGTPLNSNAGRFTSPASIQVDRQNGDIYVADGESRMATVASSCWMRREISSASGGSKTWIPCTAWSSPMTARSTSATDMATRYGSTTRWGISRRPSTCRGSL